MKKLLVAALLSLTSSVAVATDAAEIARNILAGHQERGNYLTDDGKARFDGGAVKGSTVVLGYTLLQSKEEYEADMTRNGHTIEVAHLWVTFQTLRTFCENLGVRSDLRAGLSIVYGYAFADKTVAQTILIDEDNCKIYDQNKDISWFE